MHALEQTHLRDKVHNVRLQVDLPFDADLLDCKGCGILVKNACHLVATLADSAILQVQMSQSFPNVTASVSLTAYTVDSFGDDQQAQFGQRILTMLHASLTEVLFDFTNITAGSVMFKFAATFVNNNTTQAQLLAATLLVSMQPGMPLHK